MLCVSIKAHKTLKNMNKVCCKVVLGKIFWLTRKTGAVGQTPGGMYQTNSFKICQDGAGQDGPSMCE